MEKQATESDGEMESSDNKVLCTGFAVTVRRFIAWQTCQVLFN